MSGMNARGKAAEASRAGGALVQLRSGLVKLALDFRRRRSRSRDGGSLCAGGFGAFVGVSRALRPEGSASRRLAIDSRSAVLVRGAGLHDRTVPADCRAFRSRRRGRAGDVRSAIASDAAPPSPSAAPAAHPRFTISARDAGCKRPLLYSVRGFVL